VTTTKEDRMALFTKLQDPATQHEFWSRVAEDVDWIVKGTHPLAGRYHTKAEFVASTFDRLAGVLPGGAKLEVRDVHIDGDIAIAELHSTSLTNEGAQFANEYCWVCRFEGDLIVEVRAYLDSLMVTYTILRNEAARKEDECGPPA
jgi:ketosteroid isomerase-like protein